jgi:hypothetical protein
VSNRHKINTVLHADNSTKSSTPATCRLAPTFKVNQQS